MSVDFAAEEVVLFFARRTGATDSAADKSRHAKGDEQGRQIAAQVRQVREEIVHFKEPHSQLPSMGHLNARSGLLHGGEDVHHRKKAGVWKWLFRWISAVTLGNYPIWELEGWLRDRLSWLISMQLHAK
ncbi:MAG TPA: hypothetical protein VFE06_16350 [Acidobacteriaceae bacterium]|jgi:hypothetical protein|nr:hypothetical protein [Acidobacteriaceae bacterium]